ncbi:MAG: rod shape-determining protein RodA [Anaerolineae bacterium]
MKAPRAFHTVSIWRRYDFLLLFLSVALVALGLVLIYSSYEFSIPKEGRVWSENLVIRQAIFSIIGFGLFILATIIDYRHILNLARILYIGVLMVLLVTAVFGHTSFGAQSWLTIQNQTLQPSELAKVLVILVVANVLGVEDQKMEKLTPLIYSLLVVLPPTVLIYLQPDFGTAMILMVSWIVMVFLAGVRWRHLAMLTGIAAVAAPILWFQLKDYQRDRILGFLYPAQATSQDSYNIRQALIGIGSGSWWGKGLLHGTQSQLYFLRVRHTDFIFSVWAEEMGFVGAIVLIAMFVFLIWRLVRIALAARDNKGQLLVAGIAAMIFLQTFISLGMNANIMPVTGLPLPLVSYGGSSLIATLLALGLAENVAIRSKPMEADLF